MLEEAELRCLVRDFGRLWAECAVVDLWMMTRIACSTIHKIDHGRKMNIICGHMSDRGFHACCKLQGTSRRGTPLSFEADPQT